MKISLDSNAWEEIYREGSGHAASVRQAILDHRVRAFICEFTFRVEAITKRQRPPYFSRPHMSVKTQILGPKPPNGFMMKMSIGPDDDKHPGLPLAQSERLRRALADGIKLMRGQSWMGLPGPPETRDSLLFVVETANELLHRQDLQLSLSAEIERRGVGKAAFDGVGGWTERPRTATEQKHLARACAEWADAELVAAHFGYGNDILCTNDFARGAGRSILDSQNRAWLAENYGVRFMTVDELVATISVA